MRPARIAAFAPSEAPSAGGGRVVGTAVGEGPGKAVDADGSGEAESEGSTDESASVEPSLDEPAPDEPTEGEADPGEPDPGAPDPGELELGELELGELKLGDSVSADLEDTGGPPPVTSPGWRLAIGPGEAGGRNGTSRVWVVPSESSCEPAVIAANVGTDAKPTRSATISTYRRVGPENPLSAR
jgi:hypothetical protein